MDLVAIRNRDAVCNSLEIAEHFEKRHKNVLRSIEKLIRNDSAQNVPSVLSCLSTKTIQGRKIKCIS